MLLRAAFAFVVLVYDVAGGGPGTHRTTSLLEDPFFNSDPDQITLSHHPIFDDHPLNHPVFQQGSLLGREPAFKVVAVRPTNGLASPMMTSLLGPSLLHPSPSILSHPSFHTDTHEPDNLASMSGMVYTSSNIDGDENHSASAYAYTPGNPLVIAHASTSPTQPLPSSDVQEPSYEYVETPNDQSMTDNYTPDGAFEIIGYDDNQYIEGNQNPVPNKPKCEYCMFPPCNPTVYPYQHIDALQDAEDLKTAMDGPGTDEKKLIEILTARSDDQVKEIMNEYTRQGSTLLADLKSDTSLNFKKILEALVTPLPVFYAKLLKKALKKYDADTLIEIMTSLSDCALREVSVEYASRFKRSLPEKIIRYTNLDFEHLMLALARGNRQGNQPVNPEEAYKDAKALIAGGVDRWGTDENTWFLIFSKRSFPQLREIFKQYDELRKSKKGTIEEDIKSEFSGKVEQALLSLVKNIKDQSGYFSDELTKVLSGGVGPWPSNNEKLIRIVRGRSAIDLADIKERFQYKNRRGLWDAIGDVTTGHYKETLLKLVGE